METGIDEAGRGPVMGPLVIAAVRTADPEVLHDMGCRDSKTLSPAVRQRLARLLEGHPAVDMAVRVLEPEWIDEQRQAMTLNEIEVRVFGELAAQLPAPRVVVDAADVDAARFGQRVQDFVPDAEVVSEHQADGRHPTVAAASIIAKTTRDAAMATLARRLERKLPHRLGSGYPSDPHTRRFLEHWVKQFGDLPPGVRRSWKTAQNVLDAASAPRAVTLGEFDATV